MKYLFNKKTIIFTIIFFSLILGYVVDSELGENDIHTSEILLNDVMISEIPMTMQESNYKARMPENNNIQKQIIYSADLQIEIDEYQSTISKIKDCINRHNGYIEEESEYDNSRINFEIRVKQEEFNLLIDSLLHYSREINSKHIKMEDVTSEYIDIKTRLKNKKEVESKYLQILKRAKTVKDVLEVESKIGEIREEIESTESRLKYLNKDINYSKISLLVLKWDRKNNNEKFGFGSQILLNIEKGWTYFLGFVLFLLKLWPFFIVALLLIYIFKKFKR